MASDLYKIEDTNARYRAAVKIIEEMNPGFEVALQPRSTPRRQRHPSLKIVPPDDKTT